MIYPDYFELRIWLSMLSLSDLALDPYPTMLESPFSKFLFVSELTVDIEAGDFFGRSLFVIV